MHIELIKEIIKDSTIQKSDYSSSRYLTYSFETEKSRLRNEERGLYLPCLSLKIDIELRIIMAFIDTETVEGLFEYKDFEYYEIMDFLGNNNL